MAPLFAGVSAVSGLIWFVAGAPRTWSDFHKVMRQVPPAMPDRLRTRDCSDAGTRRGREDFDSVQEFVEWLVAGGDSVSTIVSDERCTDNRMKVDEP